MAEEKGGGSSFLVLAILGGLALLLAAGLLRGVIAPKLLPVGSVLAAASGWIPGLADEAARVERWATDPESPAKMRQDTGAAIKFLRESGKLLLPWIIVLAVGLGIWVIQRSPRLRYSSNLDLEGLLKIQVKTFPRVRPILFLAGRMDDKSRGPFTSLLSPYEWSVRHGVIEPGADAAKTWRSERAHAAFSGQLSLAEKPYHRWFIAALGSIAVAERDRGAFRGDLLMDGLAAAFTVKPVGARLFALRDRLGLWEWSKWKGAVTFSMIIPAGLNTDIEATYTRVTASKLWETICARHAHVESRIVTLLGLAQAKVPVPPAAFVWVKALDRTLWYALHGVGLLPATSESGGIRSHMQAELAKGAALATPSVQAAINALYAELAVDGWHPPKGLHIDDAELYAAQVSAGGAASSGS